MSEIQEGEEARESDFHLPGRITILYTDLFLYTILIKVGTGNKEENGKGHF